MLIETPRLRMRPLAEPDFDALVALNTDPDVMFFFTGGTPMPMEKTESRFRFYLEHHRRHGFGICLATDRADGAFVGICGIQYLENTGEVEVGYRLMKAYWGRGLATEGARACVEYGFTTVGLERIVAVIHPDNIASQRVLEKIGLRYERDAVHYEGPVKFFGVSRDDFFGTK